MEQSFDVRISPDGKVIWRRPDLASEFTRAAAGRRMKVTFTEGPRSQAQNGWFHAIFKEFSEKSGYSPAASKEYLKARYIEDGRGTADLDFEEAADFGVYCEAIISELFG